MSSKQSAVVFLLVAAAMVLAVYGALRFAGPGPAIEAAASGAGMTKAEVEKIVHSYLLENPQVIFEAVDKFQANQASQERENLRKNVAKHEKELFSEADPIVAGNPKGDVTIVEFFDYHCPYCKKVKADLAQLLKEDGNIRLVLKEFPILSKSSVTAARAAIASMKQGKYWEFHLELMGADDRSEEGIYAAAQKVGIDVARLKEDMKDPKIQERLDMNVKLATDMGVDATPTFVIGREPSSGALTLAQLKEAVKAARDAQNSASN